MKKQTKGAIAAAAAGALLLGGAGSYAVWNDSKDISTGSVTSGVLTLGACTPATGTGWTSLNPTAAPISAITSYRIVPTEVVAFNCDAVVTAVGDRLTATIVADPSSISGALASNVTATTTLKKGTTVVSGITAIPGTPTQSVNVEVRLAFNNVTGTTAQNQAVDLTALKLVLTQTALTAP